MYSATRVPLLRRVLISKSKTVESSGWTKLGFLLISGSQSSLPSSRKKEKTKHAFTSEGLPGQSVYLRDGISRLSVFCGRPMEIMAHHSNFLLPSVPTDNGPSPTYALIVLNQPLPRFTPLLWKHAQLRVCADGGANRVHDELPQLLPKEDAIDIRKRYKPDVITGDMDSVRRDVLDFYTNLGTRSFDEAHDQDTTDLHKCVAFIRDSTPNLEKSNLCILVAGALGGRFDHEIGNINILCRFSTLRIILLSNDCLIQLLPRTHCHEIHVQSSVEGPHCGLIPIGMPSGSTTTTGLQWDLTDTEMRFGGLVSTSNIVKDEKITVQSDTDLLWTISIKSNADYGFERK